MELAEIMRIVWKRMGLIVLGTLLIAGVVLVVSINMKPVYQARVTLMVDQSTDAPYGDYTSLLTGGNLLALTYSELLKARPLLEIVVANLNLDLSPDDLREHKLGTSLIPETQLLELMVEDTDAQRAADIANEIAFTFISLHNTEHQVQHVSALEQDVVTQMKSLKDLIEHNQSVLERSRATSGMLTEDETTLLQTTLSNQQLAYTGLLGSYLSIRLTQAQLLDITMVESAVAPTKPVRPNVFLYTFLGAAVGLVFSLGVAFLLEYVHRSFETSEDVRQILSLPTLGMIPRLQHEERDVGLVAASLPRAPITEAYRTMRTNIRFASVDEPLRTLLITSAEPSVGKTTVVANLGVVCAQAGLQVVLVDTDLRRPTLHKLFNLKNHRGLTDLLIDNIKNVEGYTVDTGIDNLRLVSSGPIPPNPSELLGSKRMEAVLTQVRKNADLVVLDTSPTLVVTDTAVLAPKVDGVILLIEAQRTSHEAARRVCEAHQHVGSTILGTVLTKVKTGRRDSSYYYYAEQAPSTQHPAWKNWFGRLVKSRYG
jgi:non-specific protein-tyrosine kinase